MGQQTSHNVSESQTATTPGASVFGGSFLMLFAALVAWGMCTYFKELVREGYFLLVISVFFFAFCGGAALFAQSRQSTLPLARALCIGAVAFFIATMGALALLVFG